MINYKGKIHQLILPAVIIFFSGRFSFSQGGEEWPSFHGPDRSNKSMESGLLKEWPDKGPDRLFVISGLGAGYSCVSIGGGMIFTAGQDEGQTCVFAFDLNGKLLWKSPNGKAWTTSLSWASSYIGPRSTPTYNNGRLYHLSEAGRLACYDSKTGKEIWSRDIAKDFDASPTEYGYSESVLVDDNCLFVRPSGKKGFQVCLNRNTGATIWTNNSIPGSEAYTSMVIDEYGGFRQIVGASSSCFYGTDIKTGKLLWKVDFQNERELNLTDPVIDGEYVFMTSGYGKGSMLIRLKVSLNGIVPEIVWQNNLMDNQHGGAILHNGHIYGSGTNSRGWFCLDFKTGKQLWNENGKGSLTFADDMLYLLDERSGSVKLVQATPQKFTLKGEFVVPREGDESFFWAHPVVCGGRLYIRHGDRIFVYNVRKG